MSSKVTNGVPSHKSVAVAGGKTGVAGHNIGETTTGQVITGGVLSDTEIVRLQEVEFPQASVAVQVRVTLYEPAQEPGVVTSLEVRVNKLPQASVAVAVANSGVAGQLIVVGAGKAAITGAVTS